MARRDGENPLGEATTAEISQKTLVAVLAKGDPEICKRY
jgi:hypothetical protein